MWCTVRPRILVPFTFFMCISLCYVIYLYYSFKIVVHNFIHGRPIFQAGAPSQEGGTGFMPPPLQGQLGVGSVGVPPSKILTKHIKTPYFFYQKPRSNKN